MRAWLRGMCVLAAILGGGWKSGSAQQPNPRAAPRVTDLAGSRDLPGLFTQRLVMPAGFCSPVHIHNQDLHGLVMRGDLVMGLRDSTGRLRVREDPVGSFVAVPAGQPHLEGSRVETEVHISGIGPLRTTALDSATPAQCTPGKDR